MGAMCQMTWMLWDPFGMKNDQKAVKYLGVADPSFIARGVADPLGFAWGLRVGEVVNLVDLPPYPFSLVSPLFYLHLL